MVKRALSSSPSSSPSPSPSLPPDHDPISDGKPDLTTTKSKKKSRSSASNAKSTKTAWSAEEDALLHSFIEEVIRTHLWARVKRDGRLVKRTSYGVQYHALMMLRGGKSKGK